MHDDGKRTFLTIFVALALFLLLVAAACTPAPARVVPPIAKGAHKCCQTDTELCCIYETGKCGGGFEIVMLCQADERTPYTVEQSGCYPISVVELGCGGGE